MTSKEILEMLDESVYRNLSINYNSEGKLMTKSELKPKVRMIKNLILNLTDLNPNETINNSTGATYTYNYVINVFAVNYEILKIMGGMVGVSSAN